MINTAADTLLPVSYTHLDVYKRQFVDNAAMKMIQEPAFFDVMVTENTFGDILTDEGSVISLSLIHI